MGNVIVYGVARKRGQSAATLNVEHSNKLNLNTIFKRIFLFKRNNIDKIVIFIGVHKMFPTALRGIHDRNITRKSGNNLLNGIETGGGG